MTESSKASGPSTSAYDEPSKTHSRRTSLNNERLKNYGSLLFTLQSEPQHLVTLLYLVKPPALDRLVLTIMNSIYGLSQDSVNNTDEESLLLRMVRMVLSRDLAVKEGSGQREAYWRSGVAGRILGAYARRKACQFYVATILGEYVARIVQHEHLNVEIDPVKVYQQIVDQMKEKGHLPTDFVEDVTPMEAGADSGVQAIIKQRVTMLNEIATNGLSTIIGHPEAVPIEIHRLCGLIQDICKEQQPDLSDEGIRGLLGEFLFVRVLIPALLRPHAHGLVGSAPSKNPSRTLALVSTMIRCIPGSAAKDQELYMEMIVNEFSVANREGVDRFLQQISVADGPNTMEDIINSPGESLLSIRLDALYHLHALLIDFSDKLAKTEGYERLSEILLRCGPRPSQAQLDSKDGRLIRCTRPSSVATSPKNNR